MKSELQPCLGEEAVLPRSMQQPLELQVLRALEESGDSSGREVGVSGWAWSAGAVEGPHQEALWVATIRART